MNTEMKRPLLYAYFNDTADVLLAEYKRSKGQSASANLGENRELFCQKYLKGILPPRLEVHRGEMFDSVGGRTGQLEIIIVRDDVPRVVFGGSNSYFVESVLAVIEVKSKLSRANLGDGIEQLRQVSDLKPVKAQTYAGVQLHRPLRCIFAYEGAELGTLEKELTEPNNVGIVDLVCVLKRGVIIVNGLLLRVDQQIRYMQCDGKAASLAWLYFYLATYAAGFIVQGVPLSYFEPINAWADSDSRFSTD